MPLDLLVANESQRMARSESGLGDLPGKFNRENVENSPEAPGGLHDCGSAR